MKLRDVLRRADLAIRLGVIEYARDLCERVLESYPGDLHARRLLGQALLELGNFDEARQQFDYVLEVDPENVLALGASGVLHSTAGRFDAAVRAFEHAYELSPNNAEVRESLLQLYAQRPGTPDELDPVPPVAVIRWQLRHGELERALDGVNRLLISRPADVYLLLERAEALWRVGRHTDAERTCRQLLARHPRFLKARLIQGHILACDLEREVVGVDMLHQAVALDPSATIARALFRGTSVRPPILSFDVDVELPEGLQATPNEVEAALGVFPSVTDEFADDEWSPPAAVARDLDQTVDPATSLSSTANGRDDVENSTASTSVVRDGRERTVLGHVLAVSCRGPLVSRYGYDGFQRLGRRLQTVARELDEDGFDFVTAFVDDPGSMGQHNLDTVSTTSCEDVKKAIDQLIDVLERDSTKVLVLLLIGGDDVVPFFHLPNPADDDDPAVPTDNPYAVRPGGSIYAPDLPIGRLPDGGGGNLGLLLRQIDTLLEVRRKRALASNGLNLFRAGRAALGALGFGKSSAIGFACATNAWREVTEQTLASLGNETLFRFSPPTLASEMDARLLAGRRLLHFNLHGVADGPTWYGQDLPTEADDDILLPVALTVDHLSASDLNAPVVFSSANFGAHIFSKSSAQSLALRILSEGAAAFVGSTVGSYGASQPPLEASDLLATLFWENVRRGDWVGSALQRAKQQYVQLSIERQGHLDGDDQKTLLEFVLYGDPLCALFQPGDEEEAEEVPPDLKLLCNQSKATANGRVASPAFLRTAIELAVTLSPDIANGSVRVVRRSTCLGTCEHRGHREAQPEAGAATEVIGITARKEISTEDGGRIAKFVHVTLDDAGNVLKTVVSR